MAGDYSGSCVCRKRIPETIFMCSLYSLADSGKVCVIFKKVFLFPSGLRFFMVKFCRNVQKESAWCQFFLHSCIVAFNRETYNNRIPPRQRQWQAGWIIICGENIWPDDIRESVIFAIFDYLNFAGIFAPENIPVTRPKVFQFVFPYVDKFLITKDLSSVQGTQYY